MIQVSETQPNPQTLIQEWGLDELQQHTLLKMANSNQTYDYDSFHQLRFELRLRSLMVRAAKDLYRSGVRFATFEKSACNPQFWTRTENGGFMLRAGRTPADGIRDIFRNGNQYAFECTTAIMIVCYKAILEAIREQSFNALFPNLFLWDGYYDEDLGLTKRPIADGLAGDIRYFKNPEFDPKHPEWQGENTVDLGNGMFYGHGIGIGTPEMIIAVLNRKRRKGATQSAYLLEESIFPHVKHLAAYEADYPEVPTPPDHRLRMESCIIARVGSHTYICL